jgi:hypothetical protein
MTLILDDVDIGYAFGFIALTSIGPICMALSGLALRRWAPPRILPTLAVACVPIMWWGLWTGARIMPLFAGGLSAGWTVFHLRPARRWKRTWLRVSVDLALAVAAYMAIAFGLLSLQDWGFANSHRHNVGSVGPATERLLVRPIRFLYVGSGDDA